MSYVVSNKRGDRTLLISGAVISGCLDHRPRALQMPRGVGTVSYTREKSLSSIQYGAHVKQRNALTEGTTQRCRRHGRPMMTGWIAESRPDQQPRGVKRPRRKTLAPMYLQNRPLA